MFSIHAEKTQLTVHQREPITSGSVNVYTVRFDFSDDWDGMEKTATFRFHDQAVSTVLDANGKCTIPWEIIDHYERQQQLYVGVCGTKNGEVVLPTIWASLGTLLEGTTYGRNARPPTPDLLEQKLAQKQDKLLGDPGQIVMFDEKGFPVAQDLPETGGGDGIPGGLPNIATDDEVEEMLNEVFGDSSGDIPKPVQSIATEEEVTEMLDEVFSSSNVNK